MTGGQGEPPSAEPGTGGFGQVTAGAGRDRGRIIPSWLLLRCDDNNDNMKNNNNDDNVKYVTATTGTTNEADNSNKVYNSKHKLSLKVESGIEIS